MLTAEVTMIILMKEEIKELREAIPNVTSDTKPLEEILRGK